MSKKIACGAKNILIDIKLGNGALIKTKKEAKELSRIMIKIGKYYNRSVKTIITDMNTPLGCAIGNTLEVLETVEILQNKRVNNLSKLSVTLAAKMVAMGLNITYSKALGKVLKALKSGEAYQKFTELVRNQGGDLKSLKTSSKKQYILSIKAGKLEAIDALKFGELALELGAGRKTKNARIDHSVGIILNKKLGDKIKIGDLLCTLYIKDDNVKDDITKYFTIK
jgi:pyrimidine-nucleoside phosphorylase